MKPSICKPLAGQPRRRALWLAIAAALMAPLTGESAVAADPGFGDYAVSAPYKGQTRLPDFSGRDKAFRNYRTRIREGMKEGPNFAGEFTLVQIGCGTGCSFAYIANNRSGKVHAFPRGGEENLFMQFAKRRDSRLLILQWGSYATDSCVIEYFEWTGSAAVPLKKVPAGNAEACGRLISENLAGP